MVGKHGGKECSGKGLVGGESERGMLKMVVDGSERVSVQKKVLSVVRGILGEGMGTKEGKEGKEGKGKEGA